MRTNNDSLNSFPQLHARKPYQIIELLIDGLSCDQEESEVNAFQEVKLNLNGEKRVVVVKEGVFEIHRGDKLVMVRGSGPYILGLAEALQERGLHQVYSYTPLKIISLPLSTLFKILDKENLWKEIAYLIAWQFQLLVARDEELTSVDAYRMVCAKLLEISIIEKDKTPSLNVVDFIKERTKLSSSMVHQIISDLKQGGYITVNRGRLLSINQKPPLKY